MGNVWAVYKFEWRRALTVPRMAWLFFLFAFPIGITLLIRTVPNDVPREPWSGFLFALLPMLVCMLGTFLWTAPAVSAELERESWIYLAIRPGGRTAVLLGKYLAAVSWTLPAALLSMTICVLIASAEINRFSLTPTMTESSDSFQLWFTLARLICFSCPAYAAIYLLLGTLFTKRSMVIAVIYTLVFELAVSFVPAVINKLTIQFRLRALLVRWAEIPVENNDLLSAELFGDSLPRVHVFVLIGYTAILLLVALWVIRRREYAASAGGDT